jgi:hypothetical protein
MRRFVFFLFFILLEQGFTSAQNYIGVGACAMYNFQTNGIGLGLRGQFPLIRNFSIVPQIYYFPSFNKVNELFLGANLHYEWRRWHRFTPYLTAGGFYNRWMNNETSGYLLAKPNNFIPEAGLGVLFLNNCWRPFIEHRYNPIWKEGTLRIGIMWYPKMCSAGIGPNRKTYACPRISK